MQSYNKFSINFKQQKSEAKKRLKAIRQGDESAFTLAKKFHSHPDTLSIENIQLADVHFSLAREVGLPSWSKLKAHIEELELHKQAITNKEQALDNQLKTLHVRCGHDTRYVRIVVALLAATPKALGFCFSLDFVGYSAS